jgi:hypothetical protein
MLRKAFGQARGYVTYLPGDTLPPYILVLDVGRTLLVWDRWQGGFGGFGAGKRIDLPRLADRPDDIRLLRDIWEFPKVRDPRERAQRVTKDIAEKLALLAASLEIRGLGQERVSRFLMRCVFTMFAEDVRLLPDEPFLHLINVAMKDPDEFGPGVVEVESISPEETMETSQSPMSHAMPSHKGSKSSRWTGTGCTRNTRTKKKVHEQMNSFPSE